MMMSVSGNHQSVIHKTASEASRSGFTFGPFWLRPDGILLRGSEVITLAPKELAVLRLLLSGAGRLTSIAELRRAGWGETHVSADSLPRCISSLRARLEPHHCIATVYKRGYRLTLPVIANPDPQSESSSLSGKPVHLLPAEPTTRGEISAPVIVPGALQRLAILPFRTRDEEVPANLGSEIAEATMLRLSRVRVAFVDVLASTSIFELASRGLTALEVGEMAGAHLGLAGTITAQATHFRLRVELFRVHDAVQLWVEDFFVPRQLLHIADLHLARLISARIRQTFLRPSRTIAKLAERSLSNSSNLDFTDALDESISTDLSLISTLRSALPNLSPKFAITAKNPLDLLAIEEVLV